MKHSAAYLTVNIVGFLLAILGLLAMATAHAEDGTLRMRSDCESMAEGMVVASYSDGAFTLYPQRYAESTIATIETGERGYCTIDLPPSEPVKQTLILEEGEFTIASMSLHHPIMQIVVGQDGAVTVSFANPEAFEQACDNNPAAVRAAIETVCTAEQVAAIEAAVCPAPTLEQQTTDLKTALALVKRVSADASKDPAVLELEKKITTVEATKPLEPIEEPKEPIVIKK